MKFLSASLSLWAVLSMTAGAQAASINMDDPHRALGREGDVRIDAQLAQETVFPGSPISVTYQIQNFSDGPVAVADGVSDASYDQDTRTITVALGSEVPPEGDLPRLVLVEPGEKVVLRGSATPAIHAAAYRSTFAAQPRFVRIKVAILRDVRPFVSLIRNQGQTPQRLPDELFDKWFESNRTIFLNELPVQWSKGRQHEGVRGADSR